MPRNPALPAKLQTIGDHIRKVRIDRGLLQADVAQTFGVIEQSITNWENNRGKPQIRYYPTILAFLGYYPFEGEINTLHWKIARLRYWNGLSYKRLGAMLGVHGSTVRAWEHAEHSISQEMASKIALLVEALPDFATKKKEYHS